MPSATVTQVRSLLRALRLVDSKLTPWVFLQVLQFHPPSAKNQLSAEICVIEPIMHEPLWLRKLDNHS